MLRLASALLPVRERVLGPDHPGTLATRRNIAYWAASALAAASQDAQAIEALSRAVTINDLYGAETAEAATDLRNLAELQQRNGLDQPRPNASEASGCACRCLAAVP